MRTREEIIAAIAAERQRQVEVEGYDAGHDDEQNDGELAEAAACYASGWYPLCGYLAPLTDGHGSKHTFVDIWPWSGEADKRLKHSGVRRLEIAAALLIAEIERLERKGA